MVSQGLSSPPKNVKFPHIELSPPKNFEYLPLKDWCLDWQCFLNCFGSQETFPVVAKCFELE